MSSQEFEERVRILQNMRPFTLAEEEEVKRQRKLIKNREYAQTSPSRNAKPSLLFKSN
jgi:hypothetical protein